jgi:hypothetical protein
MASWRADAVLKRTESAAIKLDLQFNYLAKSTILHRSVVVQLDSIAQGVGAKVCIISLSLSSYSHVHVLSLEYSWSFSRGTASLHITHNCALGAVIKRSAKLCIAP